MCLCGDTYCWSCGPAQGNERCYVCRRWSLDGGCADPAACEAEMARLNQIADAAEAADAG